MALERAESYIQGFVRIETLIALEGYMKYSKRELVDLLINSEQYLAVHNHLWIKNEFSNIARSSFFILKELLFHKRPTVFSCNLHFI